MIRMKVEQKLKRKAVSNFSQPSCLSVCEHMSVCCIVSCHSSVNIFSVQMITVTTSSKPFLISDRMEVNIPSIQMSYSRHTSVISQIAGIIHFLITYCKNMDRICNIFKSL